MVRFVAATLLVLALAGCSSEKPADDPIFTVGEGVSEAPPVPVPSVANTTYTDILWLAEAPKMTTTFPSAGAVEESPLVSDTPGVSSATWSYPLTRLGALTNGNATLWVRLPSNAIDYGYNPTSPGCPWTLVLGVRYATDGSQTIHGSSCEPNSQPVSAGGEGPVDFTFHVGAVGASFEPGDTLFIRLTTKWVVPPGGDSIVVLSSADEFESRIEVPTLQEVVQDLAGQLLTT